MNILGVIPARGGSKSIPRKNLADLAGKPLLAFTAECALASKALTRVVLNTDDPEIAQVGKEYGIETPFLRPIELAGDDVLIRPVVKHMLTWLSENESYLPDVIALLQPTSPYRLPKHIDQAVEIFKDLQDGTVVSVVEVPHHFVPNSQMKLVINKLEPYLQDTPITLRKQEKPTLYARNGPAILVIDPKALVRHGLYYGSTYPFIMDRICSVDIDSYEDLMIARSLYPLWLEQYHSQLG